MDRDFEGVLHTWKRRAGRKPLVLKGARQTGKTFVLEHFGRSEYGAVQTLNFEADPRLATVFAGELAPERLLRDLALLGRFDPAAAIAGRALIFFDEVQICPRALTSLKYFAEHLPGVHLAAAGSLLGVELSQAAAFPVGKVELHTLHPLTFFGETRIEKPGTGAGFCGTSFRPAHRRSLRPRHRVRAGWDRKLCRRKALSSGRARDGSGFRPAAVFAGAGPIDRPPTPVILHIRIVHQRTPRQLPWSA